MSAGLIASNKIHRAIFMEVVSGETDPARIAKKTRIVKPAADRAMADLEREGVIATEDGKLKLTPEGERVAHDLKRQDFLS